MADYPMRDVWGIGRAIQAKLLAHSIHFAGQPRDIDPKLARQIMTVVGERIVHELNGRPCIALETVAPQRKGCAVTRSFGQHVTQRSEMEQAVAGYATRLGEKLRRHGLATDHVTVFMHTSQFNDDEPQRNVNMTVDIPEATNDSLTLIKAARRAVDRLWQSGFRYSKAGIIHPGLGAAAIPAARPIRYPGPRQGSQGHGRNGRGQPPLGPHHGGAGGNHGRAGQSSNLHHQVRDAIAALHDAVE